MTAVTNYQEVSTESRRAIDAARDELHRVTIAALKTEGIDYVNIDLTEAAESIALEGVVNLA
jgi:hypothetical protein